MDKLHTRTHREYKAVRKRPTKKREMRTGKDVQGETTRGEASLERETMLIRARKDFYLCRTEGGSVTARQSGTKERAGAPDLVARALVRLLGRPLQPDHAPLRVLLRDLGPLVRQAVVEHLEAPRALIPRRDHGVREAVDGEIRAEGALEREEAVRARPGADARDGRVRRGSERRRHEAAVGNLVEEDLRERARAREREGGSLEAEGRQRRRSGEKRRTLSPGTRRTSSSMLRSSLASTSGPRRPSSAYGSAHSSASVLNESRHKPRLALSAVSTTSHACCQLWRCAPNDRPSYMMRIGGRVRRGEVGKPPEVVDGLCEARGRLRGRGRRRAAQEEVRPEDGQDVEDPLCVRPRRTLVLCVDEPFEVAQRLPAADGDSVVPAQRGEGMRGRECRLVALGARQPKAVVARVGVAEVLPVEVKQLDAGEAVLGCGCNLVGERVRVTRPEREGRDAERGQAAATTRGRRSEGRDEAVVVCCQGWGCRRERVGRRRRVVRHDWMRQRVELGEGGLAARDDDPGPGGGRVGRWYGGDRARCGWTEQVMDGASESAVVPPAPEGARGAGVAPTPVSEADPEERSQRSNFLGLGTKMLMSDTKQAKARRVLPSQAKRARQSLAGGAAVITFDLMTMIAGLSPYETQR